MTKVVEELLKTDKNIIIHSVLKRAFEVKSEKELLLARADYVRMLDYLKTLTQEDDIKEILSEIQEIFTSSNIDKPISSLKITKAHLSTLKAMSLLFNNSNEFKIYIDISNIIKEIEEFDTKIAKEIFEALKEFDIEFKIIGNRAYEKLYIKLIGLFTLYKDEIKSSSKEFKDILEKLLNKINLAKNIIKSTKELTNETIKLITFIGD